MRMKIKIAETAQSHGLKSAYALQKALDISPTMASRLWKGEFDKIGINTLEKLCDYFYCQPNDLLEYPLTHSGNTQSSNETQSSNTQSSNVTQSHKSPVSVRAGDDAPEGMLSLKQVAERLGVSRKSVNDYVNKKLLKATKGKQNHNFVSEVDLLEFQSKRERQE